MSRSKAITRVLVLSNHQILRRAVESFLAQEFDVVAHGDSQAVFDNLGELGPDVIVVDVDHLDMMDGYSTARWLHDVHPEVGAIFMNNLGAGTDTDSFIAALATEGNFSLDTMRGALSGMQSAIRGMAADGPEYLGFGYRLKLHDENDHLPQNVLNFRSPD